MVTSQIVYQIKKIGVLLVILLLFACSQKQSGVSEKVINSSTDIVLFNFGNSDRNQISRYLDALSICKPKIIAINAIFEKFTSSKEDSSLQKSFKQADNIILVSNIVNNNLIRSNDFFLKACKGQGFIDYGDARNKIDKHMLFKSNGDQLLWSFPYVIIANYDFELGKKIMQSTMANQLYDIDVSSKQTFDVVKINESNQCDCSKVKDRIIIMGYLGPDELEDTYMSILDENGKKTYSSKIIGQMVDNLLHNTLQKSSD